MPELPEVETIARYLREGREGDPAILGKRILRASLLWERTLAEPALEGFFQRIEGQAIDAVGRRGKFLVLRLTLDYLLIHLRMSGDIRVEPAGLPFQPHDRLVLEFEDGLRLAFNDTRKFGRAWLVDNPQSILGGLGLEPLDEELTSQEFYQMLHGRRRQLKPLLLDQTFLAGVGNIYADEALHLARLHPLALSDSLSMEQAARLLESLRFVLTEGIRTHGASIDWVYRGGGYQEQFRVYGREGQPCLDCGAPIMRLVIGQRSTHICPACQALEG